MDFTNLSANFLASGGNITCSGNYRLDSARLATVTGLESLGQHVYCPYPHLTPSSCLRRVVGAVAALAHKPLASPSSYRL